MRKNIKKLRLVIYKRLKFIYFTSVIKDNIVICQIKIITTENIFGNYICVQNYINTKNLEHLLLWATTIHFHDLVKKTDLTTYEKYVFVCKDQFLSVRTIEYIYMASEI